MIPTPNTPTRADALESLKVIDEATKLRSDIHPRHFEIIEAALTAPIEKVEGLDEALTRYEQDGIIYDDQDHNDRMIEPLYEAARLYAQGRTQSVDDVAIGKDLKTYLEEHHHHAQTAIGLARVYLDQSQPEKAKEFLDRYCSDTDQLVVKYRPDLAKLMGLSTTTPVPPPIEKVDGLAEAVKIYDRQVHPGLRNDAVWLHPIVKAARLQLQRQGD